MPESQILVHRQGPIARVTLNRPEVHNAFDEHLIAALTELFEAFAEDGDLRCVLLTGAGRSFSAGADLSWMRRTAEYSEEANLEDARRLERMLRTLDELPKPTIAMVNGAAMGGGVGLVAACDIAIAAERAVFALSEVRLGLVPAVISPYVLRAVGIRACRRYFLTGERFDAAEARRIGLLHEVVAEAELEIRALDIAEAILKGGPEALADAKSLIRLSQSLEGSLLGEATARLIARRRASAEGREGVAAFLEKRPPAWRGGREG